MNGKEKQQRKQHLDSMLSNSLQETLERKAQSYKKYGLEKQAKKIRAFKKQVREMVGTLWVKKAQRIGAGNISNPTINQSTIQRFQPTKIGGTKSAKLMERKIIGTKVREKKVIKLIKIGKDT